MQTPNLIWPLCASTPFVANGESCEPLNTYTQRVIIIVNIQCRFICSENEDPTVRGLALRSICSLRLESILEYIQLPLHKSLTDVSAYVRKTGVMGILKVGYDLLLFFTLFLLCGTF